MTIHALRGAFAAVCKLNESIQDWYEEASFRLYYFFMCQDPVSFLHSSSLNEHTLNRIHDMIGNVRNSALDTFTIQAAAGDHARPTFGHVWQGLTGHLNEWVKPSLDIVLRTGINAPLHAAFALITALVVWDYLSGGHTRDIVDQMTGSMTDGTTIEEEWPQPPPLQDTQPDIWTIYGRPSVF